MQSIISADLVDDTSLAVSLISSQLGLALPKISIGPGSLSTRRRVCPLHSMADARFQTPISSLVSPLAIMASLYSHTLPTVSNFIPCLLKDPSKLWSLESGRLRVDTIGNLNPNDIAGLWPNMAQFHC